MGRSGEVLTLLKFIDSSAAQPFEELNTETSDPFGLLAESEVICFKSCVIEAVEQKSVRSGTTASAPSDSNKSTR